MRIDADNPFADAIMIILEISCPEMVDNVASNKHEEESKSFTLVNEEETSFKYDYSIQATHRAIGTPLPQTETTWL